MASESHKTVYLAPAANAGIGVGSGVLDLRGRERIVDGGKEEGGVGIVFAVLAVALVLEGSALVRAARRTHGQAKAKRRSFARHIRASRDPTTKTSCSRTAPPAPASCWRRSGSGRRSSPATPSTTAQRRRVRR